MGKVSISLFALLVCFLAPGARASLISLDPTATGSIRQQQTCGRPGCFALEFSSTNPLANLDFWFTTTIGSSTGITSVGYLVFDLSGLGEEAKSATLELDLHYATNANPNLTVRALGAATAADLATNPVGTQGGGIDFTTSPPSASPLYEKLGGQYFAISSGAQLGVLSQVGALAGRYSIDLTSDALSLINATSGVFALGLTWTPNTGNQFPSGSDTLSFNARPQLRLNDNTAAAPLPGTSWLVLIAILFLVHCQSVRATGYTRSLSVNIFQGSPP